MQHTIESVGVIRIHSPGGPEVLTWENQPISEPGPTEVRIRQTAIGLNFIDTYHRNGLYALPHLPHGIGMEAAGVIDQVGSEVIDISVGQHVAYASGSPGAYAQARIMPAEYMVPLPPGLDDRTAAAILLKGMTTEYLIRRTFRVEPGMVVLFHAAAGGVGLIASQWLSHLGAIVIGTVGNAAKAELAKSHGCRHVINYASEDVVKRVKELTGGIGVDVVYDGVGKATFEWSMKSLKPRGTLVSFGNASGPAPLVDPLDLSRYGSLFLTRPKLGDYTRTRQELLDSAHALFEVIQSGVVSPLICQTWPLQSAVEAHKALEARQTTGSSLLIV